MIKIKTLRKEKLYGRIREIALWKCVKCNLEKEGRGDMRQTTDLCRACQRKTHGMEGTKVYNMWLGIKSRCYNKNNNRYSAYGSRGIKVCKEWHDPEVFIKWAMDNGFKVEEGVRNTTQTIERIDVNKDYCPENCKLIPLQEQHYNKQRLSASNTSGYVGVHVRKNRSTATIDYNSKRVFNKSTKTAEHAAVLRELYILENNLPSIRNFTEASEEDLLKMLEKIYAQQL